MEFAVKLLKQTKRRENVVMNNKINVSGEQLENAFHEFNQLSKQLTDSYGDLESQVVQLTSELAEARSERLKYLAEKEVLADRLEQLLKTLPAGVVELDAHGVINQVNPIASEMLGDDCLEESWEKITKEIFISEGDALRLKDGRWVTVRARPLGVEAGKIILISDISETHNLQETVNRQQRLTSLGEMISSLAHQIRTPLASVILYLSNLNHEDAKASDRRRFVSKARERLHHLERIVNDMLVFARGGISDSECFCLDDFTRDLERLLTPQFIEANGRLIIDNQVPEAPIRGNRDALLSVFQNLATNAIEASSDVPILEIKVAWSSEEAVEFSFRDNGSGISDKDKKRIMEPFYTTKTAGTGLGLAVVNATIENHNGELTIDSKPGEGSCFKVKLPLPAQNEMLSSEVTNSEVNVRRVIRLRGEGTNDSNYFNDYKEAKQ